MDPGPRAIVPDDRQPGSGPAPCVLVTRPEPGGAETAALVAERGWTPLLAPALVLRGRAPARLPPAQALLLPSRASARALPPLDIPVFAVGDGTAAEARGRGFTDVTAASGEAVALAALVGERLDPARGPLLLAVGRGYSTGLAAALRARGFRVIRRVVYEARPAEALPPDAVAALAAGRVGAAFFTSPRGARTTIALLSHAGLADRVRGIRALAISGRIAAALAALPWASLEVTDRPDPLLLPALLGPCPDRSAPGG